MLFFIAIGIVVSCRKPLRSSTCRRLRWLAGRQDVRAERR
jgi:hypothetical protein